MLFPLVLWNQFILCVAAMTTIHDLYLALGYCSSTDNKHTVYYAISTYVVLVQSDYDYVQAAQMCILIILIF